MAMTLKQWAAAITTPAMEKRRDAATARAIVNDSLEKARISAPFRESYERGLAEFERAVAESRAKQARRQGGTPDAAVQQKFVEDSNCSHEDTEFRCVKCDSANINLAAANGADEFGVEDREDGAWCWDCEEFVEYTEVALPVETLRRILEAVAA